MKKRTLYLILLILLILNVSCVVYSQNVIYSYDAAGNRIFREIVIQSRSVLGKAPTDIQYSKLSERDIRIFQNQADGMLKIEISGYDVTDRIICNIFTYSGRKIISVQPKSSLVELNMESLTKGVYILHISLNDEETSWKIIKK